jgi:polyisoprenoid-binding protein YceI
VEDFVKAASLFSLGVVLFATAAQAEEMSLQFDPAQTRVEWTLGDMLHTVHGTFKLKRGNIRFDPATGNASGELIVDAASGESGSGARDSRMHKNILESQKYPDIVFRPQHVDGKIAPEGSSQVQVHGVFDIHGAPHEITVPAQVEMSGGRVTADLTFPVPYVKWGLKNPSTLLLRVDEKVDIRVRAAASIAAAPQP